jgi:hypothetical protein
MRATRGRSALVALPAVVTTAALFAGCSGILGIDDVYPWDGGDASQADGAGGDVASMDAESGTTDTGGQDATPCSGPTMYVSVTTGMDSNPGCSSGAPKKTLAATFAAAKAAGTVTTIEVCAGSYPEDPLTLDFPVSLLGGYACSDWTRSTTYGYPSFDPTNETTVAYAGPVTSVSPGATLTVTGTALTSSTIVDGFTLQGPASGSFSTTGAAVLVSGGSSPTLSNDQLQGGGAAYTGVGTGDPTPGSAGIVVNDSASPGIKADLVSGGSGTTGAGAGNGSAGFYADGTNGDVTIQGSTIHGGTGQATGPTGTGSTGVLIETATGTSPVYTVETSRIDGGYGQGTTRATRGLYVDTGGSATLDLKSCFVEGGDEVNDSGGATTGTLCPHGVEFVAKGNVNVTGNRIYGGRCNIPSPDNQASLYGLYVTGGAVLVAENNMIHMGTSGVSHEAAALGIAGTTGDVIRHNTLVAGPSTGSATVAALWIENGVTGAVIENNILAASGLAPDSTGFLLSCPADAGTNAIQSFQYNLVFAQTFGLMQVQNCGATATYTSVDAMDAALVSMQPGITAVGNLTFAPSAAVCGGDSGCIAFASCASQATCLTSVFAGFDVNSYGYLNLFPAAAAADAGLDAATPFVGSCPALQPPSGDGWPIAATPPCLLARSGDNDSATVAQDLYGNCRSTTAPTMGAAEYAGTCQ